MEFISQQYQNFTLNTWSIFITSMLFWMSLNFFIPNVLLSKFDFFKRLKDQKLFTSNCIGIIHAILVSTLALIRYYRDWNIIFCENGFNYHHPYSSIILAIMSSYLLSDLISSIFIYKCYDKGMIVHHIIGFIALFESSFTLKVQSITLYYVLTEASTPFVNGRWMLNEMGLKNSSLYLFNGLMMFISFFIVRVLPQPLLYIMYYKNWNIIKFDIWLSFKIIIFSTIINSLNLFWFSKIFRGLLKAFYTKSAIPYEKKMH